MSVVSEVIPVPGAAGGARPGARGAAGDPGEALRVPGVRQEVLEVGGSVGSQEDPCGEKVGTFFAGGYVAQNEISLCDIKPSRWYRIFTTLFSNLQYFIRRGADEKNF